MNLHLSQAFDAYIILQQLEQQDLVRRFVLILPFNAGQNGIKQMTWPWEYSGALGGDGFKQRLAKETGLFREHVEYELQTNGHQVYEVDGRLMYGPVQGSRTEGPFGREAAAR